MNKFIVNVMEKWSIDVEVDAFDEKDAIMQVDKGCGVRKIDTLKFEETMDKETWTVNQYSDLKSPTTREEQIIYQIKSYQYMMDNSSYYTSIPDHLLVSAIKDLKEELRIVMADKDSV